jgi:glycosyltransferase involved in cell wall biosynthesis
MRRSANRARRIPPRVLFAIGSLRAGGSEGQLVELMTRMHPHRIEAVLVTYADDPPGRGRDAVAAAGIAHRPLGPFSGPFPLKLAQAVARIERAIRAFRPDAIYAWLEESSVLLAPLGRLHGIPVVVSRQNIGAKSAGRALRPTVMRWAERAADVVTTNSETVLEHARARGIATDRLRLVRNGHPDAEPLPEPDGPVTIGYVARFRPEKGHLRLLDALERLDTRVPWRVRFAGDGPIVDEVRRECERRGLAGRTAFLGHVADVRDVWAGCHLGALLSDHEGSPNALLEAAFAGRPFVATAVGGTPDLAEDGAGLLVGVDDHAATAAALARLIEDADLRREAGRRAYALARRRFGMEQAVDGHVDAILSALDGAPRTAAA